MIVLDGPSWVFLVGLAVFCVAAGAFISSRINSRKLTKLTALIEHNTRNSKMVQEALKKYGLQPPRSLPPQVTPDDDL